MSDAHDVFRTCSEVLSDRLNRLPDGETGDRHEWIHFQIPIIAATPGIAPVGFANQPDPPPGTARTELGVYGLAEGADAESLAFGNLRYADAAIASYAEFRALKDAGVIPDHIRFQVSLPTTLAVMAWILPADRAAIEPAYQAALLREVSRIVDAIPHDQLAIQFDLCIEVFMVEGFPMVDPWFDDVWEGILERVEAHAAAVPDHVQLGFHLCYGDNKGERQVEVTDAANLVRLANELTERLTHSIGFIHMPVPRESDVEAWAPPLGDLRLSEDTHLYFGIVHRSGGLDEARDLVGLCERYVERFGVATECGMGRLPADAIRPILEIHRAVAGAVA